MNKRWVIKEVAEQEVDNLHDSLKINRILCQLLVQRNIKTYEEAKRFFRPSLDHLHDPFLMKDMDRAVERIDKAMRHKEKILVYGDYDVDGTTAVALVYSFFKELYFHIDYYVPNRYTEGYGVSERGIEWAASHGFSLIIALDCGIKATDKVRLAKEKGIDFIICDHHRPGDELPPAHAILDPKRADCSYPYDELSGCGIGFKLVQAFAQKEGIPFKKVTEVLDLVAVSIAADIVPIDGENRVLAHFGLRRLNRSPRPGLRSLIEMSARNKRLNVSDIVFIIAPRINAAGRMDDAKQAVKLLISQEGALAKQKANVLQEKNHERKQIDSGITEEAINIVQNDEMAHERKSTVLYRPHWHKGVIGIVASRLIEKFYRPTIVMTDSQEEGLAAGSARSVRGFDIYNAIKECGDLLEQFGGHKYAAGLSIQKKNVPAFIEKFERVVAATITDEMLVPEISIDAELPLYYVNHKFYNILRQFAPFGPKNLKPIFLSQSLQDTGWSSVVGKKHLKLYAKQDGAKMKGIGYNLGFRYPEIAKGNVFDLCYTLEENAYNGHIWLQANIKDIKESEPELEPEQTEAANSFV